MDLLSVPLSDNFIRNKYKINVYKYDQILNFKSIDDLLGYKNAAIILYEHVPGYGHWTAVLKYGDTVEFFNSYGNAAKGGPFPDDQFKLYSKLWRKASNQLIKYLTILLLKSNYKLEFNDYQFQSSNLKIQTCGRWCVYRILNNKKNIDEFAKHVIDKCEKLNLSTDEMICKMIKF